MQESEKLRQKTGKVQNYLKQCISALAIPQNILESLKNSHIWSPPQSNYIRISENRNHTFVFIENFPGDSEILSGMKTTSIKHVLKYIATPCLLYENSWETPALEDLPLRHLEYGEDGLHCSKWPEKLQVCRQNQKQKHHSEYLCVMCMEIRYQVRRQSPGFYAIANTY